MKMNTIQISPDEDRKINRLQKQLRLPTKKAVVIEGLRVLQEKLHDQERRTRLQAASHVVRGQSKRVNTDWSHFSTALKTK